jgi:hypothetical protein
MYGCTHVACMVGYVWIYPRLVMDDLFGWLCSRMMYSSWSCSRMMYSVGYVELVMFKDDLFELVMSSWLCRVGYVQG